MANREVVVPIRVENRFSNTLRQFTQEMGRAEEATRRGGQAAQGLNAAYGTLQNVLNGAVMGLSIGGVIRMTEGLYEQGRAANRAAMFFESYADRLGSTSEMMERLRAVTRGTLDDTTLQNAANSLLTMGLAQNADQLERLTNIGVTFAQAMGTDVQTSMENLSLMLANQSYLRLDTLGISSGEVRRLAEGYRQAGLDSSEAFTAAFMDVADRMLPQMTAVADASVTALDRLGTQARNIIDDMGQGFATSANSTIELVETAIDVRQERLEANAELVRDLQSLGFQADMTIFSGLIRTDAPQEVIDALEQINRLVEEHAREIELANDKYETLQDSIAFLASGAMDPITHATRDMADAADELDRAMAQIAMPGLNAELQGWMPTLEWLRDDISVTGFAFDGDLVVAQELEERINQMADHIREIAGSDPVNAVWVERAEELAANAAEMADEIERARDAFEDMTLDMALGLGGDSNELLGGLLGGIDLSGMSEQQRRRWENAFGLSTGEQTLAGVAYQDVQRRLQALADSGVSPDVVIRRAQQYESVLANMRAGGFSDRDIADALRMEPSMAARQFGFSLTRGEAAPSMEFQGFADAEVAAENIDQTLSRIPEYGDKLSAGLTQTFDKPYDLSVRINVSEVAGLTEAILAAVGGISPTKAGGSSFAGMLAQTVQDAGGTVPGSTGRGKNGSGTGLAKR